MCIVQVVHVYLWSCLCLPLKLCVFRIEFVCIYSWTCMCLSLNLCVFIIELVCVFFEAVCLSMRICVFSIEVNSVLVGVCHWCCMCSSLTRIRIYNYVYHWLCLPISSWHCLLVDVMHVYHQGLNCLSLTSCVFIIEVDCLSLNC